MVVSGNRYLNRQEMQENANHIMAYLLGRGWTKNAIAGMLGNMESESTINPGIWQNLTSYDHSPYSEVAGQGYGLVQWTPFNKYTIWARDSNQNYAHINTQLRRIDYEVENGLQWISSGAYPMTFKQFKRSTQTPEHLAQAFLINYERPANMNQPIRSVQARYWFNNTTGSGTIVDFIFPTDAPISSGFRPDNRPDHVGIDFAKQGDVDIYASASGVVSRSYVSDSYGEVIFILHEINGQTYETVYAHLRTGTRYVQEGDTVTQGQVIGKMGNTGDSTGQHLHFELHVGRWNDSKSNAVNPLDYLNDPIGPIEPPKNRESDLIHLLLSGAVNGW